MVWQGLSDGIDKYSIHITLIFWISSIVGTIWAEKKYNISNIFNRKISHFRNKQAEISLAFRYKHTNEFDDVKSILKKSFKEKDPDYRLLNEKKSRIAIGFDVFTIEIINDEYDDLFFEILKTGCGITDLKVKIEKLVNILDEINKDNNSFLNFESCDISLSLPYEWKFVKIYEPKDFELKSYKITMQKLNGFKSSIDVSVNSINASLSSTAEILSLLDGLL